MSNRTSRRGFLSETPFAPGISCGRLGEGMPLLVTPFPGSALATAPEAWRTWLRDNNGAVMAALNEAGAMLFRGFAPTTTRQFGTLFDHLMPFSEGCRGIANPRATKDGRVLTSTSAPPGFRLHLHQEICYAPSFPDLLVFHCVKPSPTGGETTLGDMRRMRQMLPATFNDKLDRLGIIYRRHFVHPDMPPHPFAPAIRNFHRSWDMAFGTKDRKEVEAICSDLGSFEWGDDGSLEITYASPGTIEHPFSSETIWFNQIATLHANPRSLGHFSSSIRRLYPPGAKLPTTVTWGDGSVIIDAELQPVYAALDTLTVATPWERDDVMLVDNISTAHGRNIFSGEREIEVAMFDNLPNEEF
ncbi:TauD/TfdA family dioxygenase [Nguyenibacter vanlangensis]|nr:TauD/TfdA family dioxygenase [Nguyenibacter vanlangensis]